MQEGVRFEKCFWRFLFRFILGDESLYSTGEKSKPKIHAGDVGGKEYSEAKDGRET